MQRSTLELPDVEYEWAPIVSMGNNYRATFRVFADALKIGGVRESFTARAPRCHDGARGGQSLRAVGGDDSAIRGGAAPLLTGGLRDGALRLAARHTACSSSST